MGVFFVICFLLNSLVILAFNEDSFDSHANEKRDFSAIDDETNHRAGKSKLSEFYIKYL